MLFTNVLVAVTAATLVVAQNSTAGISACILDCSTAAATANGCVSFTNVTCVCSSAQFQADAGACLTTNCPDQVAAATNLQLAQCGAASISPTGTAGPPRTLSITLPSSSAPTSTSPAASHAPSATSGASATVIGWSAVAVGAAFVAML